LYDAANEPSEPKEPYLLENARHKKVMSANSAEYEKRVVAFLERHLRQNDPAGARVHLQEAGAAASPADAVHGSPNGKLCSTVGTVVWFKIEQEERRWF
jgi:hypothetical protein